MQVPYAAAAVSTVMVFAPPSVSSLLPFCCKFCYVIGKNLHRNLSNYTVTRYCIKTSWPQRTDFIVRTNDHYFSFVLMQHCFCLKGHHFISLALVSFALQSLWYEHMIAFIQSLMIGRAPSTSNAENSTEV
ncbi:hippocampus abundant transcript-like protein 1 [Gossypium australe]|uniref:Hippocampus abundant transcript-like protein 1 n=1 Tax=Gossypium australe TaxID=47621 RepID=A0A5B6V8Z9_9ROSI|nr:hippocampus abundant transcript-like protein 1 [Gossypium australe]